jgi:hypothetical protein
MSVYDGLEGIIARLQRQASKHGSFTLNFQFLLTPSVENFVDLFDRT